jgi:dTDP-glucose 4,6-dehydratase
MLFVSSGAVYGTQPPALERIPETHAAAPGGTADAYADGKREAEKLCAQAARHGLRPRIARCFAFVGPHLPLDAHFAVGNFLRDARDGREIAVAGDGTPYRSYLHAADLVAWLVTILAKGASLRAYNVGSDQAVSIADLAHRISLLPRPPVQVTIRKTATGEPAQRYVPEIDRARRELGLEVGISLDAALRRSFDWLRAQPAGAGKGS